jgi:hypothetical protein
MRQLAGARRIPDKNNSIRTYVAWITLGTCSSERRLLLPASALVNASFWAPLAFGYSALQSTTIRRVIQRRFRNRHAPTDHRGSPRAFRVRHEVIP